MPSRRSKAIREAGWQSTIRLTSVPWTSSISFTSKSSSLPAAHKMTKLSNTVEQKFNTFRAKVGDKNEHSRLPQRLKDSTLSERRKDVWEASRNRQVVERS